MEKWKIDRINELARKKKEVGLTEDELKERDVLRREYIDGFKANFIDILDNTMIQQPDGTKTPLQRKPTIKH